MGHKRQIVSATVAVMTEHSVDLEKLIQRAPRGFWEKVSEKLAGAYTRENLSHLWKREEELREAVANRLTDSRTCEEGDHTNVDNHVHESEAVVNVEKVATEEEHADAHNPPIVANEKTPEVMLENDDKVVQAALVAVNHQNVVQSLGSDNVVNVPITLDILNDWLNEFEVKVTEMVKDIIDSHLQTAGTTTDHEDAPPRAPKDGKRELGAKCHISARADWQLVKLFEQETERHGGSASRTLDVILWNYFKRPPLSFELIGEARAKFEAEYALWKEEQGSRKK